MRPLVMKWAKLTGPLLFLTWTSCARVPAGRVILDRMDYGQVIADSWKRQTLLNVVRLRYADAPVFLDVASVINSYSVGGSVSGGGQLQNKQFPDGVQLGAGGSWSNTPTVTYQPLLGERFTRSLLQPVPPAAVFQLMQGGWPADLVMKTVVRTISGLRNDSFGAGGDPGFRELVEAMTRIQRAGNLGIRVEARPDGTAVVIVLRREGAAIPVVEDERRVRELLGLAKDTSDIEVTYGLVPRSGGEVAMITRSMLELILELGFGIDLPSTHATDGRATPGRWQAGEAQATPLVRVRSGAAAPPEAYAAVPYKGYWYWIEDNDIASKRVFSFLLILFSLAETGQGAAAPVVTVPSR